MTDRDPRPLNARYPPPPASREPRQPNSWLSSNPAPPLAPEDIRRKVQQAIGKGQIALLVVDAAGTVIAGIKATGGLTQLRYLEQDGTWEFAGAFSNPEVLEGSVVLRNRMGMDPEPPEDEPPAYVCPYPDCRARSWNPQDARHGYCGRCHRYALDRPVELPRRQPGKALETARTAEKRWGPT